jgi:hypothetical protein
MAKTESGSTVRTGALPKADEPVPGDRPGGTAPERPAPPSGALSPKLDVGPGGRR